VAKSGRDKSEKGEKKSKKKLILMIVGFVAIAGFAAKSTVLKPKPLTAQQLEAKKAAEEKELTALCAAHNDMPAPATSERGAGDKDAGDEHAEGDSDTAAHEPELAEDAPVLELEPITVNLADGHFLKVGVALALEPGTLMEEAKDHGIGAQATNLVIDRVSGEPMAALMPSDARIELRKELGNSICTTYEGRILTIYFTDFVMQ
jgi:flagellar basal body-associated protein FliL